MHGIYFPFSPGIESVSSVLLAINVWIQLIVVKVPTKISIVKVCTYVMIYF